MAARTMSFLGAPVLANPSSEDTDFEYAFDKTRKSMRERPKKRTTGDIAVALCGQGAVGKTSLVVQWVNNRHVFETEYDPTVEDNYVIERSFRDRQLEVNVIDTSGQEEFHAMRDAYIKECDGLILVYAINERSSFKELSQIVAAIKRIKESDIFPCVLVEQKCDLEDEREVSHEEGAALARQLRCPLVSTSAKLGTNISGVLETVIARCFDLNMPQMSGWLEKKGRGGSLFGRRNWLKRWFSVDGTRILYGKSPNNARGIIDMNLVTDVTQTADGEIQLKTARRVYRLRTTNPEDEQGWIIQFQSLVC
eukprot:m.155783 g.155783  ORF g.155783 m.155783 type:complete len:309 (+) comp10207_c0_seq3:382-1308(+)